MVVESNDIPINGAKPPAEPENSITELSALASKTDNSAYWAGLFSGFMIGCCVVLAAWLVSL
jgi:hypothetical protein